MDKWHVIELENMLFQICHLWSEKAKRNKQENHLENDPVWGRGGALWNTDGYSELEMSYVRVELQSPCPAPHGRSRNRVADKSRKTAVSWNQNNCFKEKSQRNVYFPWVTENVETEGTGKVVVRCQAALRYSLQSLLAADVWPQYSYPTCEVGSLVRLREGEATCPHTSTSGLQRAPLHSGVTGTLLGLLASLRTSPITCGKCTQV